MARYVLFLRNGYWYCADTKMLSTACNEDKHPRTTNRGFSWLKTLVKAEGGVEYWN